MQETVKQDREHFIGGSDVPVILGISPFKSRFDLLLEKAGYKEEDVKCNAFTLYGQIMEPKIRDYICKKDRKKYKEGMHIVGQLNPWELKCSDKVKAFMTNAKH